MSQFSLQLIRNCIEDVVRVKMGKPDQLKPLVFTYFVTSACNFDCNYCPYAVSGITKNPIPQLDTDGVYKLLKIFRKSCPNIYFSGGEPLLRHDMVDILKKTRELNFKSIMMVTNMSMMHKKMEVLDYLTSLVVSLDMMDTLAYAKIVGVSDTVVQRTLDNIMACAKLQKQKNFRMTVNFVANLETLPQMKDVLEMCLEHDIRFTMGPELLADETVDPKLANSQAYQDAINYLLQLKKSTPLVIDTDEYLNTLSTQKPFECFPSLIPRVDPNGDLSYPCKPIGAVKVNLLQTGSYEKALQQGYEAYGPLPKCKDICYQNCYIMPSHLVKQPLKVVTSGIKKLIRDTASLDTTH